MHDLSGCHHISLENSRSSCFSFLSSSPSSFPSLFSHPSQTQGHATEMFGPAQFSALYEQHDAAVGGQAPQMSSIEDLLAEPGTESHTKALAEGGSTVSSRRNGKRRR